MTKVAFVFPGQGSQYVGMGKSFFDGFESAKRVFEESSDALGFDLAKICFEGPASELDRTELTQPALLAASMAALRVLSEKTGVVPSSLSGHSLGEYTALVASGAIDLKSAVVLVNKRGRFMQNSVPAGKGKMAAIIGLDVAAVRSVCEAASTGAEVVVPANINSPVQVVISGDANAVTRAQAIAKERGAKRFIVLQVSAPSHSPLMAAAAAQLEEEMKAIKFGTMNIPVISNVEAEPIKDSDVKFLLTRQLTSPVRWVDIIRRMKSDGITHIVEVGPGKVLTGLIKRIEEFETLNLDATGDLPKVTAALNMI